MNELGGSRLPEVVGIRRGPDEVELALALPADLVWFRGHFPDAPILPGVVQVDWVIAMARAHLAMAAMAASAIRVKFQAVIQPTDRLTLTLRRVAGEDAVDFEYRRGERPCSSGRVRVRA